MRLAAVQINCKSAGETPSSDGPHQKMASPFWHADAALEKAIEKLYSMLDIG